MVRFRVKSVPAVHCSGPVAVTDMSTNDWTAVSAVPTSLAGTLSMVLVVAVAWLTRFDWGSLLKANPLRICTVTVNKADAPAASVGRVKRTVPPAPNGGAVTDQPAGCVWDTKVVKSVSGLFTDTFEAVFGPRLATVMV